MISPAQFVQKEEKFKKLYEQRPSTLRSTFLYGILQWLFGIPGFLLFISGVGLIIASMMGWKLDELTKGVIESKSVSIVEMIVGIVALIASLIMSFLARLCRRIVARNLYIMELEALWVGSEERETD